MHYNSENNTENYYISKYIASRSYLHVCDHHIDNPVTESKEVPKSYPEKDGDSIYINTTAIPNFVNNYLPNIKYNFVLVSGDTDKTIPDDYVNETNTILNNKYLLKWYAQNTKMVTDKLIQLPIGLDFHTLAKKATIYTTIENVVKYVSNNPVWGDTRSIEDQEKDIDIIKNLNQNKQNKCYGNFQFFVTGRYGYDRKNAINKINKDLIYYEPTPVKRIETWTNMIKYKYIISPLGNGLDCHRTWEAIILGCIPIVKKSELDTMYTGLPVLIVNDWSDITQELLDNFTPEYYNMEKIYIKYWIDLFNHYK